MSGVTIKEISPPLSVGEGPHWIERDQKLIYVDIKSGNIHRYSPNTNKNQTLHIGDVNKETFVSFVIPIEGEKDMFVISAGTTISLVQWPEEGPDYQNSNPFQLLTVDKHIDETRFNDAKCDPMGRLWAGTMDNSFGPKIIEHKGSLYRIGSHLDSTRILEEASISNGLAWSSDHKIFYFIDSLTRKIEAFDYDITSGNISKRRTVLDFAKAKLEGQPDGMTIDVNDKLWTACYDSAQVIHVDPGTGKIERSIKFPSLKITSCCWGGPDYSTLFVTSAGYNMKAEGMAKYPSSGKTFSVTGLGTKGLPPTEFKLKKDYMIRYQKATQT